MRPPRSRTVRVFAVVVGGSLVALGVCLLFGWPRPFDRSFWELPLLFFCGGFDQLWQGLTGRHYSFALLVARVLTWVLIGLALLDVSSPF